MLVREILGDKGHTVFVCSPNDSLADVVELLVGHNCGSLVVCESSARAQAGDAVGRMVGIITERDILKACAANRGTLANLRVSDVMTQDVTIGSPCDSVEQTMGLMTDMRIRHLPVVEDGQLVGLISIGDVVKMQHDRLTMENHYLKSYLHG